MVSQRAWFIAERQCWTLTLQLLRLLGPILICHGDLVPAVGMRTRDGQYVNYKVVVTGLLSRASGRASPEEKSPKLAKVFDPRGKEHTTQNFKFRAESFHLNLNINTTVIHPPQKLSTWLM